MAGFNATEKAGLPLPDAATPGKVVSGHDEMKGSRHLVCGRNVQIDDRELTMIELYRR
jgi:hypothetical protein